MFGRLFLSYISFIFSSTTLAMVGAMTPSLIVAQVDVSAAAILSRGRRAPNPEVGCRAEITFLFVPPLRGLSRIDHSRVIGAPGLRFDL